MRPPEREVRGKETPAEIAAMMDLQAVEDLQEALVASVWVGCPAFSWSEVEAYNAAVAKCEVLAKEVKAGSEYSNLEAEAARLRLVISRNARIRALVQCGIPAKDCAAIADGTIENTKAIGYARAWLEGDLRILVLSGPPGVGKTTAAAWVAAQVPYSTFVTAAALARVSVYKREEIEPLERCRLLVIDDLGAEYLDVKGMFSTLFDGLLNERYASLGRTVLSTNLGAAQFKERYGARVIDRLRECGRFADITGESLRQRGGR